MEHIVTVIIVFLFSSFSLICFLGCLSLLPHSKKVLGSKPFSFAHSPRACVGFLDVSYYQPKTSRLGNNFKIAYRCEGTVGNFEILVGHIF